MRATQLNTQASSACWCTWLWLKTMLRPGSIPAARKAAVTSRVLAFSSAGSCHTVTACRSTTQYTQG